METIGRGDLRGAVGHVAFARGLDYFERSMVRWVEFDTPCRVHGRGSGSRSNPYLVWATLALRVPRSDHDGRYGAQPPRRRSGPDRPGEAIRAAVSLPIDDAPSGARRRAPVATACALDDDASASASDEIAAARDGQRALFNERPAGIDDQRRVLVRLGSPARRAAWLILRRSGTASRVGGLWRRMPARHRLRRWLRARETKGIMAPVAPPDSAIGPADQERPGPTRARAHLGRGASRCGSHLCTAGNETARVHRRSSPADRRRAARCSHRPGPPPSPG